MDKKNNEIKIPPPRRGFVIGTILTAPIAMYALYGISNGAGTFYGRRGLSEPFGVMFMLPLCLGLLTLLIPLLSHLHITLSSGDIGIIWIMVAVAWATKMYAGEAFAAMIHPTYSWPIAIENGWVPSFWYVSAETATNWMQGKGPIPWGEWLTILPYWIIFMIVSQLPPLFLITYLRRDWVEYKRLPFPYAQPAIEIAKVHEETTGSSKTMVSELLSSKMFRLGIIVAFLIYCLNSIRMLIPSFPIPYAFVSFQAGYRYYAGRAWIDLAPSTHTAIGLRLDPAETALFFLLPMPILLTNVVWTIVALIIAPLVGFSTGIFPELPAPNWVTVGWGVKENFPVMKLGRFSLGVGFGALIWTLWTTRRFFIHSLRASKDEEAEEAMPYKLALLGFFLSWIFVWAIWMMSGADGFYLFLYQALMYSVTLIYDLRVSEGYGANRCGENTFKTLDLAITNELMKNTNKATAFRTYSFGQLSASFSTLEFQHNMHYQFPMAFAIGRNTGIHPKHIFLSIIVAMVIGYTSHSVFRIWWGHAGMHGPVDEAYPMARNQGVNQAFSVISSGTISATQLPYESMPQIAIGVIVGAFMVFARARWAWFPLHWVGIMPIEYLAGSFVSLIIVYPLKLTILRVGGTALYRKSFLFAIGFLTGFGLECMLEGVLALGIGPRNIPYP